MPTPTAVTAAARNADELIRSLSDQQSPNTDEQTPNDEAPAQEQASSEDETTADDAQQPATGETQFTHDEPAESGDAPNGDAPQAPVEDDAERRAQLWEQRYRSLNGMIESRDRQIESLHQLLARIEPPQHQTQPPSESETQPPAITKDDVDSFGEDLIDLARRVARSEYSDRERALQARIKELESRVSGVSQEQATTAQERFLTNLRGRVPNLDHVNQDPDFIRWLGASPTRQRMFNEAVQSMDLDGTAFFFETWASPKQTQEPSNAQKPTQKTDQRLARQVAPGKSRNVPTPAQRSEGTKRQWTRSAIVSFYKNLASYPQQDRDRIERDIALAQKEGRVDFTK
jgi:hypothetical protein